MKIYIDTEFTDFVQAKLISFGLAAENGKELYVELTDGWVPEACSAFVRDEVLPLLGRDPAQAMGRREARGLAMAWLKALGEVTLVYDATLDWSLLVELLGLPDAGCSGIRREALAWPGSALARRCDDLLREAKESNSYRHHALDDAKALRQAVTQTEAEFRNGWRPGNRTA